MRRAAKKDDNHGQIVEDLKKIGFSIIETYQLGDSALDFICALHGETAIVEVKGEKGKLEESQKTIFRTWQGKKILARCTADVLVEFGLMK